MTVLPGRCPGDLLTTGERWRYILLLGALTALGPLTVDLYLPAFPQIVSEFNTTEAAVQLTLTGTAIGFALGQLVVGPWSDVVGRRLPLILATVAHLLSSILCVVAPTIEVLIFARIMMGCAASASGVVSLSVVRDLFSGRPMSRMISNLSIVNGFAPVIAPLLGAQILLVTNWRGIFAVLACYGLLIGVGAYLWIRETLPAQNRSVGALRTARANITKLVGDRQFMGLVLTGGLVWGSEFAYLQGSSFVFQVHFELTTGQYGVLYAILASGYVFGIQIGARLTQWVQPQWIILVSIGGMVVASGIVVFVPWTLSTLVGLSVMLWVYLLFMGSITPCITVIALTPHGAEAGTAAAFLGAGNFGLAGVISPLVGVAPGVGTVPMATIMVIAAIAAAVVYLCVVRPWSLPKLVN